MQNYTFYVDIFVAITSYKKILLTSEICNFTSPCPLAAEIKHFGIQVILPFSPILTHKVVLYCGPNEDAVFIRTGQKLVSGVCISMSQYMRAH
jgi:hypothetical protein